MTYFNIFNIFDGVQYKEGYYLKVSGTGGKKVTWTSTNYDVAFVSREGFVRAKGIGTATVKATCCGKTISCKVHVTKKTFKTYSLGMNAITK